MDIQKHRVVTWLMHITQHYNPNAYWKMRSEVVRNDSKVPKLIRLWYFYKRATQRRVYSVNSIRATMCIMAMLSILFGAILNRRISYTGAIFGNLFYCFVAAISGSVFFTVLFKNCKQMGSNKYLCLLGKNSMAIMVMQYWLFRLFDFVGEKTFGISVWHGRSTLKALVVSIITILLILVFVGEIKKVLKKNKRMLYVSELLGIR